MVDLETWILVYTDQLLDLYASKLDWLEVFTKKPALLISLGPSSFEKYGSLDKGLLEISLAEIIFSRNVNLI